MFGRRHDDSLLFQTSALIAIHGNGGPTMAKTSLLVILWRVPQYCCDSIFFDSLQIQDQ